MWLLFAGSFVMEQVFTDISEKRQTRALPPPEQLLQDYALGCLSREMSLLGRKEVFMGRAKFGIFGDGKEVPQLAMAHHFATGDWRAGYYRDQTLMLAIGALKAQAFFAQLYAHSHFEQEPASSGRMMTAHFGTPLLNGAGQGLPTAQHKNSSADISPTAGQMARLLGLAYASKLYRELPALQGRQLAAYSNKGAEVAWGTIGDAATSEGIFFEVLNAAAVLQVPMLLSVWDDGYGISVPAPYHTAKESISEALAGLARSKNKKGLAIYTVNGWDYEALYGTYGEAAALARKKHVPVLVHVKELTQPQGHSTSGSQSRYKPKARLQWEAQHDCLLRMRAWMLQQGIATEKALDKAEQSAKEEAKTARNAAWKTFTEALRTDTQKGLPLLSKLQAEAPSSAAQKSLRQLQEHLAAQNPPLKSDLISTLKQALYLTRGQNNRARTSLQEYLQKCQKHYQTCYSSHLYGPSAQEIKEEPPRYSPQSPEVDGREVLQACFDAILGREPRFFAIGEDIGYIGDVNQGLAGLQKKHGLWRVTDTGIREASIVGQGIGAAMRGLRPLVEIQYLDYVLYALQTLSDDLATLHYRSGSTQKAPLIVRTRGHRLEGIWHSGSPMGVLLHALRGMYILVPRNMTQAAAFYNTLLASEVPAILIECLNGYRIKEKMPENVGSMQLPLGKPEVLRKGSDLSLVTYGSMCRIAIEAAQALANMDVSVEVIDVQTLLPFDTYGIIKTSLAKTNRLLIADEDVPGGASAYILQQILDTQQGYYQLDAPPRTVTAQAHRPAYGSDGDYFSKPNREDLIDAAYQLLQDDAPDKYPPIYF